MISDAAFITCTIPKKQENPFKIGNFVRIKKRRKMKDMFCMIISVANDEYGYSCTIQPPVAQRKKNGYFADRLHKIYKHKPKKSYFK